MPYDRAREWLGAEQAAAYWRATEPALDRIAAVAGDALQREGSLRLAADDEERDELHAEYEALARRFRGRVADDLAAAPRRALPGGALPSARRPPQPARFVRRLAAVAASTPASRSASTPRRVARRHSTPRPCSSPRDGYPSGLLGELEGLSSPRAVR